MAGRRLCPYRANGFDGNLLRRWGIIANANGNTYCHSNSNCYCYCYGHRISNGDTTARNSSYANTASSANTSATPITL